MAALATRFVVGSVLAADHCVGVLSGWWLGACCWWLVAGGWWLADVMTGMGRGWVVVHVWCTSVCTT